MRKNINPTSVSLNGDGIWVAGRPYEHVEREDR